MFGIGARKPSTPPPECVGSSCRSTRLAIVHTIVHPYLDKGRPAAWPTGFTLVCIDCGEAMEFTAAGVLRSLGKAKPSRSAPPTPSMPPPPSDNGSDNDDIPDSDMRMTRAERRARERYLRKP